MDDAPRKRPLLQFSLATAIVMMFVAAGLLWANLHTYESGIPPGVTVRLPRDAPRPVVFRAKGWPLRCYGRAFGVSPGWHMVELIVNVAVGLATLAAIAFFLEWLIRRKERQHE